MSKYEHQYSIIMQDISQGQQWDMAFVEFAGIICIEKKRAGANAQLTHTNNSKRKLCLEDHFSL